MESILSEATDAYISRMQPSVDDLLEDIEAYAREHDVPIAARDVAQFQTMLARMSGAERVLEIGTAIGYTTIQLARTGTEVVTLELDPDRIEVAETFIAEADVEDSIDIRQGDANELLPELDGQFDMIFIDGPTQEYADYFEHALPRLRSGGLLVIDNLLWKGAVPTAAETDANDESTAASLLAFNQQFVDHDELDALILPLDDGTGFARKSG
jgi:caffeoyl-CoA O-methyltransferase